MIDKEKAAIARSIKAGLAIYIRALKDQLELDLVRIQDGIDGDIQITVRTNRFTPSRYYNIHIKEIK